MYPTELEKLSVGDIFRIPGSLVTKYVKSVPRPFTIDGFNPETHILVYDLLSCRDTWFPKYEIVVPVGSMRDVKLPD